MEKQLATYVLVPGAWIGGWAWRDVAARLRTREHDVFPITLTGLGERVHLASPEVDLETHIADVVNTIQWNDLHDVILAGHSYAGTVITGVADRIPGRVDQLVYVDSAPLADGMAMTDLYPPDALATLQQSVDQTGDGWCWPFPGFEKLAEDASVAGLGEPEQALITTKAVAQPWATYTQPLRLQHADAGDAVPYRRVAIACADMRGLIAAGVPEIAAMAAPPWHYLELETGHWPMFSAPEALAEMLDGLIASREPIGGSKIQGSS
jgi:pimeloyl-ACP methyl ester carboxylesterase